jgi:hypothetical protein
MKFVILTGILEVFLLFFTLSFLRRFQLLLLVRPLVISGFAFNTPYQFTPPPNLSPVIFVSKLLAVLLPFICLVYYGIFYD